MERLPGIEPHDDEEDVDLSVALACHHHLLILRTWSRRRRRIGATRRRPGSVPGRRQNKQRDFAEGLLRIRRDYFGMNGEPPVYDERDFERRFRVPRSVFMRIYEDIKGELWWQQRPNATGRLQAHPLQKLVAAFRVLAYGETPDRADEYVRLSKSTIHEATNRLVAFVVRRYEAV